MTRPAPDLTVIVISYNTRALTLAALRTLYAQTSETDMEVIVLDNASADGSADAIAAAFPQARLIRAPENLGFARANNVAAARARGAWLLLLNPDTEIRDRAVDRLMAFARAHPSHGIYGGRTVFPDGTLNPTSCWGRITLWSVLCSATGLTAAFPRSRLFNPETIGGWGRDSVREVDIVTGCFLLIPRALWDRLGGFDLKYFMYGEEADLCLRAGRLGYRPVVTPEAEIMHLVGASANTRADRAVRVARARATLIRDHWPAWKVPLGLGAMWAGVGLRRLVSAARARAGGPARAGAAALWREVWRARRVWLAGYAPLGEAGGRPPDAPS
ncbi:glycosyltransferase family 2 protein [Jannaschia seohaensis]|uniref:Glycosyltransferase 2-like domain-containing protein n=1 Tax=Jannaschia seohaensis TaxID=475081 RepID=A0A2Y9B2L9_9RHOB|nr:glycosyltransferase family 2 protein [Jannaschia seohaensis]PWJ12893.1 hypothetical protein BCF38_11529 [Jannaschia seohaensis]SSA50701.1 hypothetical protein SAMN05421539_11529 [Jannaschia seohaensis]